VNTPLTSNNGFSSPFWLINPNFQDDITDLLQRLFIFFVSHTPYPSVCGDRIVSLVHVLSPPYNCIASRFPSWSRKLGLGIGLERVQARKRALVANSILRFVGKSEIEKSEVHICDGFSFYKRLDASLRNKLISQLSNRIKIWLFTATFYANENSLPR